MVIKKFELKLLSIKTEKLSSDQIFQICTLKNSHYNYGLKSNIEWFKKNCKKNDIHNLIYKNGAFIGYTLLRNRTFFIKKVKKKYLYFDTLIINKKFRKQKISSLLMNFNNYIILQQKKMSFLFCKKRMIKFYEKFGWKKINNKNYSLYDHKYKSNGMLFNSIKLKKINKLLFCFYK